MMQSCQFKWLWGIILCVCNDLQKKKKNSGKRHVMNLCRISASVLKYSDFSGWRSLSSKWPLIHEVEVLTVPFERVL